MGKIKTYNPKEVTIALGNHIVSGYAMTRLSLSTPTATV